MELTVFPLLPRRREERGKKVKGWSNFVSKKLAVIRAVFRYVPDRSAFMSSYPHVR
jgi:hypothetical protein